MTAFEKLTHVAKKRVEYLLIDMINSHGMRNKKFTEHWFEFYALIAIRSLGKKVNGEPECFKIPSDAGAR